MRDLVPSTRGAGRTQRTVPAMTTPAPAFDRLERFDAVLGASRGGGLRSPVPAIGPGSWYQYLILDRPWKGDWSPAKWAEIKAKVEYRPPLYRNRAHAERGADSLRRRHPNYETEIRGDERCFGGLQVFYRTRAV